MLLQMVAELNSTPKKMTNNNTWLQASSSFAAQTLGQNPKRSNTAAAGDGVMKKAPSQLLNCLIPPAYLPGRLNIFGYFNRSTGSVSHFMLNALRFGKMHKISSNTGKRN